jgi:aminopeptidase N
MSAGDPPVQLRHGTDAVYAPEKGDSKTMPDNAPGTVYLKDYLPPDYLIRTVDLRFELEPTGTVVKSRLGVERNPAAAPGARPIVLNGEGLTLETVKLNGKLLAAGEYAADGETLSIPGVPDRFALEIENRNNPRNNTRLSGLYMDGEMYVTQCEAEGFRRITYFPDRPDVMARFTTTVVADAKSCPVLLSNGNSVESGALGDGRHFVTWKDPIPKPCYLFALVAGDLSMVEDRFKTASGRGVTLRIFVQHHNRNKCGHAMESLKKAMKWDEERYGREYDLDLFMIVATDAFNAGAMENKGLNIFNSKYVLADPETATDADFQNILGVVAHEYFHNWSGDRITCRDWFQLSLKEGFTVFRDQHFTQDMASAGVRRIAGVNVLRTAQFREDAGPMAHPVRPESYQRIDNFYTVTVYEKGAEVIWMMRRILGPEGFRKGTDLYFSRNDGKAVTIDDFVQAMEDANDADLGQFKLWYSQAGTPELHVGRAYDPGAKTFTLAIRQSCPPTPGQNEKKPFHIPLSVGLLDKKGKELPLRLEGEKKAASGTRVLHVKKEEERFVFTGIASEPVPSILRGFSAPVKLITDVSDDELLFLMAHDKDEFNRWDAGQQLAVKRIMGLARDHAAGRRLAADPAFVDAVSSVLSSGMKDKEFQAYAMTLPPETYVAQFMDPIYPDAVHAARRCLLSAVAQVLKTDLLSIYGANRDSGPYRMDQESIGRRSLKNACLSYLGELADHEARALCMEQLTNGGNMTDVIAALGVLSNLDCGERTQALEAFHRRWKDNPLVMDKWLAIQASSRLEGTLEEVKALTKHPIFDIKNPNKVRALIGAFAANHVRFHDPSGAGYSFVADYVLAIDPMNPQIAARLVSGFTTWKRYEEKRRALMKAQLDRILGVPGISRDTYEIVSKSLISGATGSASSSVS